MIYDDKALRKRARQHGKFRQYIGGGESVRIGGEDISGPMVLVVSRSRVDVIRMNYRDSIPRFRWSAQNTYSLQMR
jgi:hypothetical protein